MNVSETAADASLLSSTQSVCPVCLDVIDAQIVAEGNVVYMNKTCAEHGPFKTYLWPDVAHYTWMNSFNFPHVRPEQPVKPLHGCPPGLRAVHVPSAPFHAGGDRAHRALQSALSGLFHGGRIRTGDSLAGAGTWRNWKPSTGESWQRPVRRPAFSSPAANRPSARICSTLSAWGEAWGSYPLN